MILILLNIIFIIFAVTAYHENLDRYQRLSIEGRTVSATVTDLRFHDSSDGSSTYQVLFNFQADINGQKATVSGDQNVPSTLYSSLRVGQTIEVIYDVSDPNIFSIKSENNPPSVVIPVIFIVGAIVGSAFLIRLDYQLHYG